MAACVFCAIVEGSLPGHFVATTAAAVAFLDKTPLFLGHTLIVPRVHHETLPDLEAATLTEVMLLAQRIARVMPAALGAQGTFVAMNNKVSQSVPHLHVHVVPRTKGDGLKGFFWPRKRYTGDAEMAEIAAKLASALDADPS